MIDRNQIDEIEEFEDEENSVEEWEPRKSGSFISLSEITPEDRKVFSNFVIDEKFENIEKLQFKCQPRSKNPDHISLEGLSKKSPVKEIVYRLIVNNRKSMKLGDIVAQTLEILEDRKIIQSTGVYFDINRYFYRLLKEDTFYGFEEG